MRLRDPCLFTLQAVRIVPEGPGFESGCSGAGRGAGGIVAEDRAADKLCSSVEAAYIADGRDAPGSGDADDRPRRDDWFAPISTDVQIDAAWNENCRTDPEANFEVSAAQARANIQVDSRIRTDAIEPIAVERDGAGPQADRGAAGQGGARTELRKHDVDEKPRRP